MTYPNKTEDVIYFYILKLCVLRITAHIPYKYMYIEADTTQSFLGQN